MKKVLGPYTFLALYQYMILHGIWPQLGGSFTAYVVFQSNPDTGHCKQVPSQNIPADNVNKDAFSQIHKKNVQPCCWINMATLTVSPKHSDQGR